MRYTSFWFSVGVAIFVAFLLGAVVDKADWPSSGVILVVLLIEIFCIYLELKNIL